MAYNNEQRRGLVGLFQDHYSPGELLHVDDAGQIVFATTPAPPPSAPKPPTAASIKHHPKLMSATKTPPNQGDEQKPRNTVLKKPSCGDESVSGPVSFERCARAHHDVCGRLPDVGTHARGVQGK